MPKIKGLDSKIEILNAIAKKDLKSPNDIPVTEYIKEAENLHRCAREDETDLVECGLNPILVDDLPARAKALHEAEIMWMTKHFRDEKKQSEWTERLGEAYNLRNDIIQVFLFAYRKSPEVFSTVSEITEGKADTDVIQNLKDLASLGEAHTAELIAVNFDLDLLEKASALSDDLSLTIGLTAHERTEPGGIFDLRNRAYTHLREAVDEIQMYGRFVFRNDEIRLKCYLSDYLRRNGKKKENRNYVKYNN